MVSRIGRFFRKIWYASDSNSFSEGVCVGDDGWQRHWMHRGLEASRGATYPGGKHSAPVSFDPYLIVANVAAYR